MSHDTTPTEADWHHEPRIAALIDRQGSSSAQDSLTLTERRFIGLEPSRNGHKPPLSREAQDLASAEGLVLAARRWLQADRLLGNQAERDEEEAGRFVGLDQVELWWPGGVGV